MLNQRIGLWVQSSVQKAYNDCVKKIDNLLKLYISADNVDKSLLSEEEFRTEKLILIKEKENFSAQLGDCDQRVDNWLELTEKTFNFVTYAKYHFETGSIEDKKLCFPNTWSELFVKRPEIRCRTTIIVPKNPKRHGNHT